MRFVNMVSIAFLSAWATSLAAAGLSHADALTVAERSALDRGVRLENYFLSDEKSNVDSDEGEWVFLYKCKDSDAFGCHLLIIVDRESGATELSASTDSSPRKRPPRRVREIQESPTKEACEAKGGTWFVVGMLSNEFCDIATSDSKKQCTDNDQCDGKCDAPEDAVAGSYVTGTCSEWYHSQSCQADVVSGETTARICVD